MAGPEFYRPSDPGEAYELLARHGEKATVLAGGTNVMPSLNRRKFSPEILIWIGGIGLNHIRTEGDSLVIGATATHSEICKSEIVLNKVPLLAEVCGQVGSRAIRNTGTIGGNLANASHAADGAVVLLALEAEIKLARTEGERTVSVNSFFTGPGKTVKKPGELLKEIIVPFQTKNAEYGWYKLGQRKACTRSVISVATALHMDSATCQKAIIALGSAGPTPLLARNAGTMLENRVLDKTLIEQAAKAVSDETSPVDDRHGTAWYKKRVSMVIVKRLLEQISQKKGGI
ncbi:MAG: xanthine dehydrogenase family protein subunit M [Desulfobacterales bacterium]|nr:xanthine dehydrogenase family protein subunit M [Desulfobacterales bacterium]